MSSQIQFDSVIYMKDGRKLFVKNGQYFELLSVVNAMKTTISNTAWKRNKRTFMTHQLGRNGYAKGARHTRNAKEKKFTNVRSIFNVDTNAMIF